MVKSIVVGGCGFLGRYIVEELLKNENEQVVVFDKVAPRDPEYRHERLTFLQGDICKQVDLEKALKGVNVVYHTASPPHGLGYAVYKSVNVDGTRALLDAVLQVGVPIFVYTSTSSVVFDGSHIHNGDETLPYAKKIIDPYIETKIEGEKIVLEYNGKPLVGSEQNLKTIALRPSGIFGPRDSQAWPGFIEAAEAGKNKYIMGDGKNKMDWTYVENLSFAHVLAAQKLAEEDSPAAGQAFFITNDEPIPFWDMARYIWRNLGKREPFITVPVWIILYVAILTDFFVKILSPFITLHPTISYFRIVNATSNRYFSCEKAKKFLGYKPPFSLAEGMEKTLEYFKKQQEEKERQKRH